MHPHLLDAIKTFREVLPLVQMSLFTNGDTIRSQPAFITQIIESGINILNIDCYGNTYNRMVELLSFSHPLNTITISDFREFSAYRRYPKGEKLRVLNLVPDILKVKAGRSRTIHNYAGNVSNIVLRELGHPQPTTPLAKMCTRPFRECTITYSGKFLICCMDWREQNVLGTEEEYSLREIWYSKTHLSILKTLYRKERSKISPCAACSYSGGAYVGLVRNPFGETHD